MRVFSHNIVLSSAGNRMTKKKKKKNIRFGRLLIRIIIIAFLSSTLYMIVCRWLWPPFTITQIGALTEGYGLKRDYVRWGEIPASVKLAAIASEDQLFPVHNGFDWKAIDKSINGTAKKRGRRKKRGAGASTISQQTAKNVFLWQGNGWGRYVRKVPEFYFTQMIEWTWGKQRILEVYLNVIEMGPGVFGIEAAAQKYFHKPAKKLTQREAAMIIACLPNPKRFTVKPVSRRVQWRTPQIMRQMSHLQGDIHVAKLVKKH